MSAPKMELEHWLDDLCVRFIINLPAEDLSQVERICFQVEEAQWFYEDFIRPLDPALPTMSLRNFCLRIFRHCPLLSSFSEKEHMTAFENFMTYKTRVPVRGAIMLNEAMDAAVLVKGWKKGASWSFPRGKINKDEDDLDCAIREVYEETGFDLRSAGLVPKNDEAKYIELIIREQELRLYVFRNVPMDAHFEPKTRKEISKIQWYRLSDLPAFRKKGNQQQEDTAAAVGASKFYMVAPFLVPLKKWVVAQKKRDAARGAHSSNNLATQAILEEGLTEDDMATHLEPVREHAGAAPAADALAGATRELQRLLKVQPLTSAGGLPVPTAAGAAVGAVAAVAVAAPAAAFAHAAPPALAAQHDQGKAEALLAILQRPRAPVQIPHTPLDLIHNTTPPEPPTPHHHHKSQLAPTAAEAAPPPSFGLSVLAPRAAQNLAGASYNQYLPAEAAGGHGTQAANYSHGMALHGRRPEDARMQHPQPQHVQNRLPARDPFQSPGIPGQGAGSVHPQGNQGPQGLQGVLSSLQAQISAQPGLPTGSGLSFQQQFGGENTLPPLQPLSSHSITLLNSLKDKGGRTGDIGARNQTKQSLVGAVVAPTTLPEMPTQPPAQIPVQVQAQKQMPTDKHRTALLDMFKPQTQVTAEPVSISAVDGAARSPLAASQKLQQLRPSHPMSTAETIRAAAEANGGPVQVDPNLHLPFGALKLLSRPKNLERGDAPAPASGMLPQPANRGAGTVGPAHARAPSPSQIAALAAQATRLPATLHQAPSANLVGKIFNQGAKAPQYGMLNPAPEQVHAPPIPTGQQSAEQKSLLLSLFGKAQAPSLGNADEKGKGREQPPPVPVAATVPPTSSLFDQARPSSRVADTPPGGLTSPRSGQAPISPADRNFLLGFLQSVSSAATQ